MKHLKEDFIKIIEDWLKDESLTPERRQQLEQMLKDLKEKPKE